MEHLLAGIGTGLTHAVLYNGYDRALFMSVKHKTKFWDLEHNWSKPFQGLLQSLFHRVVNNGLYFTVQSMMQQHTNNSSYIGLVGGITNGLLLNPVSVIKYNCWGKDDMTFWKSFIDIYKNGGLLSLTKGMRSTITRDSIYCVIYENWRKKKSSGFLDHFYNLCVSISATIVASPFNYVRNVKYATPSHIKPDGDFKILFMLYENKNYGDLRIGWGTLRCGLGMVTGQLLYGYLLDEITKKNNKLKNEKLKED